MADVFAFYDCSEGAPPGQAAMVTIWARGWSNRGWNPRLITARHARRSKFYAKHKQAAKIADVPGISILALHSVGGGMLTPLNVINFEFPATTVRPAFGVWGCGTVRITRPALEGFFKTGKIEAPTFFYKNACARYGESHWITSPLVHFSDTNFALDCGRVL